MNQRQQKISKWRAGILAGAMLLGHLAMHLLPCGVILAGVQALGVGTEQIEADTDSKNNDDEVPGDTEDSDSDDTETDDSNNNEEPEADDSLVLTGLKIYAINPGYKINGVAEVGEMIEIRNYGPGRFDLTGVEIYYTNGGGTRSLLYGFPDGAKMEEGSIFLSSSKSPNTSEAAASYATSLALNAGPLELVVEGEVADEICWTGKGECAKTFKSSSPTSLVWDEKNQKFMHQPDYEPNLAEAKMNLILEDSAGLGELDDGGDDYDETEESIVKACAGGYERNPETGKCEKVAVEDEQKESNKDSNLKPCAEGYERNPETNRCRKIVTETTTELKPCAEGYERNPETNRCRKIADEETEGGLKPCAEGYERNPETNRCRKIQTEESSLKPCAEGYERNPETNRCRKIVTENDGAEYATVPTTRENGKSFTGTGVVAAIVASGVFYIILQFRREIARAARKIGKGIHDVFKNTVSRKVGGNGDKNA